MDFSSLNVSRESYQTYKGDNLFRKLRSYNYDISDGDKLICSIRVDFMNIENVTPQYMFFVIDGYYQTEWEFFVHHFTQGMSGFAPELEVNISSLSEDESDAVEECYFDELRFYGKIGMINLAFVHPDYKNKGILKNALKKIYLNHFDCGVFFLRAFDLKNSPYLSSLADSDQQTPYVQLLRQCSPKFDDIDVLKSIYPKLGYSVLNDMYNTYYIEPHIVFGEDLFKTDRKMYGRFNL